MNVLQKLVKYLVPATCILNGLSALILFLVNFPCYFSEARVVQIAIIFLNI